jgi:hypothetical protein
MKTLFLLNCWLYDRLLSLHDDTLLHRHRDEMRFLFRQQLSHAMRHSTLAVAGVWQQVAYDTLTLVGPRYLARLRLLSVSVIAASALATCFLVGFCSLGNILLVHAFSDAEPLSLATPSQLQASSLLSIDAAHTMFRKPSPKPSRKL